MHPTLYKMCSSFRRLTQSSTDTLALGAGSALTGLLAYFFISLVTRTLQAEDAAPVAVLWSFWSATASILVFPLQHWIVRRVTIEGDDSGVRSSAPRVAIIVLAAAFLSFVLAWSFRHQLFGTPTIIFPSATAAIVIGSAFIGTIRGHLASRRRFLATALAVAGENVVRALGAVIVALLAPKAVWYALALISGPLIGLAWPTTVTGISSLTTSKSRPPDHLLFLGGIAGNSLISQALLTTPPVILSLIGGDPADVTSLFAIMALYRAPYMIALGLTPQFTALFTTLANGNNHYLLRTIRRLIGGLALLLSLPAGLLATLIGQDLSSVIFGQSVQLPFAVHGILAAGTVLALGNLFMVLLPVARGTSATTLPVWLVAILVALTVVLINPAPLDALALAFLAAELVALLGLSLFDAIKSSSASTTS